MGTVLQAFKNITQRSPTTVDRQRGAGAANIRELGPPHERRTIRRIRKGIHHHHHHPPPSFKSTSIG